MASAKPSVTLIGAGALGTVLARGLVRQGYRIDGILSRAAGDAERLAKQTGAGVFSSSLRDLPGEAHLVLCCVPDDAVADLAGALALLPHPWSGCVVAHTSGALASSALAPLRARGAHLLSFHPVQSFTASTPPDAFEGIYIGLEGDAPALDVGRQLALDLGAHPFVLTAEAKPRYHLAASMASNFFVTLMALAGEVLADIGIDRPTGAALLRPLVEGTWRNLATQLPEEALTGPIARGDLDTLLRHTEALATHLPQLTPAYAALAAETVRVAVRGGHLAPDRAQHLLDTLHGALRPYEDGLF